MTITLDSLFPGQDPVLLDGAMGTALFSRGWEPEHPTALANLQAPQDVLAIHREHRRAGAQILTTNTFAALSLDDGQRGDAVRAAVTLAREAASDPAQGPALVAGCLALYGIDESAPRLAQTVELLVAQGVDLLVFETCHTVAAARAALRLKATVAAHLPMVICASSTDGSAQDQQRVVDVLTAVRDDDSPDVEAGLNCCRGPEDTLVLSLSTSPPVRWVKPSTGLPAQPADSQAMAAFARAARLRGARFIGACCGSDPATLSAMANALLPTSQQKSSP